MMKNKFFTRCFCSLCAVCLLCVGVTSCMSSEQWRELDQTDDQFPDMDPQDVNMSAEEWRELNGTSVQLSDLITPYLNETYGLNQPIPGPSPYFVGEITEIKEGYMVVKPKASARFRPTRMNC